MAGLKRIRKNDEVVVIAGKDRGKRGRVTMVDAERNRVVVEGLNLAKRHTKPNPQRNVQGGIVEQEASIHASNVWTFSDRFEANVSRRGVVMVRIATDASAGL